VKLDATVEIGGIFDDDMRQFLLLLSPPCRLAN
jgi:hypothetical protein